MRPTATAEEVEQLLDELDNARRRWRHESTDEVCEEVRQKEERLNALGASVVLPLGEQADPNKPLTQVDICKDIATLSKYPGLVAAVGPDHKPQDGEVVGVLRVGCLLGDRVLREAWGVVFKAQERSEAGSDAASASSDPWEPFLKEAEDGTG